MFCRDYAYHRYPDREKVKENGKGRKKLITVNIRYYGENGAASRFAREMIASGIVDEIRREEGNMRYEYFLPLDESEYVLLIDEWADQAALDRHHALPVMRKITEMREKYDLHMTVERYVMIEGAEKDKLYIRS